MAKNMKFWGWKQLFTLLLFPLIHCAQMPNNIKLASSVKSASFTSTRVSKNQQTDEDIYQRGVQIIQAEGVEAGLNYFEGKPVSYQSLFGIGWAYWTSGSYDKAEQVCRYLLARQVEKNTMAHVNYLMGYLHIQYVKYSDAISYFNKALLIYKETQKPKDQFRTLIGLATAHYYLAQYNETEKYLSLGMDLLDQTEVELNLGMYYYLKAHLAFSMNDYQSALEFSKTSLAEYKKTSATKDLVSGLIDISFYQQMIGNYDDGYETAEAAHDLIIKHNLSRLSYFNTINFIFFKRCNNLEYRIDEEVVRQAAKAGKDSLMTETLDFVLTLECP